MGNLYGENENDLEYGRRLLRREKIFTVVYWVALGLYISIILASIGGWFING